MNSKTSSDPNVFHSLFARLTVLHGPRHGFDVTCTATNRQLGVVFWTVNSGTFVTWHFQTPTGDTGIATTKRGAVQVLRDRADGRLSLLDDDGPDDRLDFDTRDREGEAAPPAAPRVAPRHVVWGDATTAVADLTGAIAAALKRHQGGT